MIEVIQSDRDAAAQLYLWFPAMSSSLDAANKTAQFITDGGADGWNSVQLMAAHRQQAEDAMREGCAAMIETWEDWGQWYGLDRNNSVAQEVCQDAAAAIRATQDRPAEQKG